MKCLKFILSIFCSETFKETGFLYCLSLLESYISIPSGVNKAISSSSIGKIIFVKFAMAGVSLAQINSPSPKPIKGACLLATTKEVGAPDYKTAKA